MDVSVANPSGGLEFPARISDREVDGLKLTI